VNALANGDSKRAIARALRVSNNTVTAVAEQEWQQVEARKERLAAQAERNALMAGEQIAEALQKRKYPPSALVWETVS
jgi:DNA-binding NarL/FixJ family response regulator